VTPNKDLGPQFGKTVYIFEVNGAKKVKSDMRVAVDKNSNLVQKFYGGWEHGAPSSNFFKRLELSETSRSKKHIFGLQVNIDKANSRRYDVTR